MAEHIGQYEVIHDNKYKIVDQNDDGIDQNDVLTYYEKQFPEVTISGEEITIIHKVITTPFHVILLQEAGQGHVEHIIEDPEDNIIKGRYIHGNTMGYVDVEQGVYAIHKIEIQEDEKLTLIQPQGFIEHTKTYGGKDMYFIDLNQDTNGLIINTIRLNRSDTIDFESGTLYKEYYYTFFNPRTLETYYEGEKQFISENPSESIRLGRDDYKVGFILGEVKTTDDTVIRYGEKGIDINFGEYVINTTNYNLGPVISYNENSGVAFCQKGYISINTDTFDVKQHEQYLSRTNDGYLLIERVNKEILYTETTLYYHINGELHIFEIPEEYGKIINFKINHNRGKALFTLHADKTIFQLQPDSGNIIEGSVYSIPASIMNEKFDNYDVEGGKFSTRKPIEGSIIHCFDTNDNTYITTLQYFNDEINGPQIEGFLQMLDDQEFLATMSSYDLLPIPQCNMRILYGAYKQNGLDKLLQSRDKQKHINNLANKLSKMEHAERQDTRPGEAMPEYDYYSINELNMLDLVELNSLLDEFRNSTTIKRLALMGLQDRFDKRIEYGGIYKTNLEPDSDVIILFDYNDFEDDVPKDASDYSHMRSDFFKNQQFTGDFHFHMTGEDDHKYTGPSIGGIESFGGDTSASSVSFNNSLVISTTSDDLDDVETTIDLAVATQTFDEIKDQNVSIKINIDRYGKSYTAIPEYISGKYKVIDLGVYTIDITYEEYKEAMDTGRKLFQNRE